MVDISTVEMVTVQTRSALDTSRRELAEEVSSGIDTLLAVGQSSLENCPKRVRYTRSYTVVLKIWRLLWGIRLSKLVVLV